MTWDEALAALLGLIGRDVEVAVIAHGHAAPLVAHFTGVMAGGDELTLPRDGSDAERLFFFADDADTGFFIDKSAVYRGAVGRSGSNDARREHAGSNAAD